MNALKYIVFIAFVTVSIGCTEKTLVQKDIGGEDIQGLKYINDAAISFMDEYNKKNNTKWQTLEPDYRSVLPRCITPLKTVWAPAEDGNRFFPQSEIDHWFIRVLCEKSVSRYDDGKWDILIQTTRPDNSHQ